MNLFSALVSGLASDASLGIGWLGWQLLRQNDRLLLRLEELENRFDALEFGPASQPDVGFVRRDPTTCGQFERAITTGFPELVLAFTQFPSNTTPKTKDQSERKT